LYFFCSIIRDRLSNAISANSNTTAGETEQNKYNRDSSLLMRFKLLIYAIHVLEQMKLLKDLFCLLGTNHLHSHGAASAQNEWGRGDKTKKVKPMVKGVGRKIFRGGGATEKNSKKLEKILNNSTI